MSTKRILIVVGVIAVFALIGGAFFAFLGKKKKSEQTVTQQVKISPAPQLSTTMKEYKDPSGFTFQYPEGLELKNIGAQDPALYSLLQLSSKDAPGSITVRVRDSKYKSLEAWKRDNAQDAVSDKLGNLKAVVAESVDSKKLTAIDQDIEFTVDVQFQKEKGYWENVYKSITSTFAFTPVQESASAPGDDGVTFEGEEVVE